MATGYTSAIEDGISFKDFVLRCARAFGALSHMRDEPMDADIKEITAVSEYNEKELIKAKNELEKAKQLSLEDAKNQATLAYDEAIKYNKEQTKKAEELKIKYLEMLTQVREWEPPTTKHVNLKQFMIEQIEESIKHDNSDWLTPPEKKTAEQWLKDHIKSIQWSVNYHSKDSKEEKERWKDRNEWVRKLKESLE